MSRCWHWGGLGEEELELPHARHRQFQWDHCRAQLSPAFRTVVSQGKCVWERERHCPAGDEFGNCPFPSSLNHLGLGGEPGVREWSWTWEGEERRWFNFCLCFPLSKSIWYFKVPILLHLVTSHQNVRLHLHLVLKCSYRQATVNKSLWRSYIIFLLHWKPEGFSAITGRTPSCWPGPNPGHNKNPLCWTAGRGAEGTEWFSEMRQYMAV